MCPLGTLWRAPSWGIAHIYHRFADSNGGCGWWWWWEQKARCLPPYSMSSPRHPSLRIFFVQERFKVQILNQWKCKAVAFCSISADSSLKRSLLRGSEHICKCLAQLLVVSRPAHTGEKASFYMFGRPWKGWRDASIYVLHFLQLLVKAIRDCLPDTVIQTQSGSKMSTFYFLNLNPRACFLRLIVEQLTH